MNAWTTFQDVLMKLVDRVDVAADLYVAYMVLLLMIGVPITIRQSGFRVRFIGILNQVTKPFFIIVFVGSWWAYDVVNTLLVNVDWQVGTTI